ncbi:glycosyltransferase family 2 protein, partial [bacterium]|nr:glycosyltransferase family 2 protein [bacterium]
MYKDNKIALVIPALNEERLIGATLEAVPETIDRIYVIDDGSQDQTAEIVRKRGEIDPRVELLQHQKNQGVGAAIITGYLQASADDYDIAVVVGGDHQMPLEVVEDLLEPIVRGAADYTKGTRFLMPSVGLEGLPWSRFIGNAIISIMTKMASGYYKIYDVVDGYTAITKRAIGRIDWGKARKADGYP